MLIIDNHFVDSIVLMLQQNLYSLPNSVTLWQEAGHDELFI